MAEIKLARVEKGAAKIQTVPIAVTPEGFWCCPTPAGFQKALKAQAPPPVNNRPKPKLSSPPHKQTSFSEEKKPTANHRSKSANPDDRKSSSVGVDTTPIPNVLVSADKTAPKCKNESLPRKVSIEFGDPVTSDIKVVLHGKQGFSVKLNVHKNVLVETSSFFAERLLSGVRCLEIDDCEDVEIYVETVGLMYCKDRKQRLIKQSVQRVLRILKVAETIGFSVCIQSCLAYLEAVPWIGEDEEENVVSSVSQLRIEGGGGVSVNPVLKRVSSVACEPPKDTLSHIVELVLKSNDERGRREMKSTVLKLLRESNDALDGCSGSPPDICYQTIYASCRSCLDSLVLHFREAAESSQFSGQQPIKDPLAKQMALEADNLVWLLEILAERQTADELALMWASQQELATLHGKLQTMNRYHISCITARLFVGIGKGELLPSKDTRHMLLQTWLQPLINDYTWLLHGGCRSFDRKAVDEGIGRTILTLPLEEQRSVLLSWLGSFLKAGDNCPNLQKAFEVWWRRTFIRPYAAESQARKWQSNNSTLSDSL
ncbi:hypothetical protein Dimus_017069 [Dionaea muscipula]